MAEDVSKVSGTSAARSIGWLAVEKWGDRIATLVVMVVLGRLLAPAAFGLVALAGAFVTFAGLFVDSGFGKAIVQRRELSPEHTDATFWLALSVAVVLTLVMLGIAPLISSAVSVPELTPVLRWMTLGLVVRSLSATPAALLERNLQFGPLAARRVLGTLVGGSTAVVVALAGGGVWSLVARATVEPLVGVITLWTATTWRPRFRLRLWALRELWPIGFGALSIELLAFVNSQADRLIIGAFLPPASLGIYHMAQSIVSIIGELFTSIFGGLGLSMFSRLQADRAQLRAWLYRLAGASSALALPSFALAVAVAPVVIPFVFGPQWHDSVPLFRILSMVGAINAVAYFDRNVLLATGHTRAAVLIAAAQSVIGVLLVFLAVGHGVTAVAVAIVVRQYTLVPLRLTLLKRKLDIDPFGYLGQWFRPLLASLLILGVLCAAFAQWPVLLGSPYLAIPFAVVVGAGIYLPAIRVLSPKAYSDMRAVLTRAFGRF